MNWHAVKVLGPSQTSYAQRDVKSSELPHILDQSLEKHRESAVADLLRPGNRNVFASNNKGAEAPLLLDRFCQE